MVQLILILFPLLIIDMLNPVLLGGTLYTLGTRHPYKSSSIMLLSFGLTYFGVGLLLALGLEYLDDYFTFPLLFDHVVEFLIALLLFYIAHKQWKEGDTHLEEQLDHERHMTVKNALWLGLQINLVGLPFAVPYLAAIDQILKKDAYSFTSLMVLFGYNLLYVLPYAGLMLVLLLLPGESKLVFRTINRWMHRLLKRAMPILLFLLGLILLEDSLSFILGYREYSVLSLINP